MASQTPSSPPPTAAQRQYWCYHCDKRVSVETLPDHPDHPDLLCSHCNFGFVESLPPSSALSPPPSASPDYHYNHNHHSDASGAGGIDEPSLGSQFLHILRILAQVARDDHSPPPPPPPPPRTDEIDNDFLRIEIDGWDHHSDNNNINRNSNGDDENDDDDEGEGEEDDEEVRSVEEEEESDDDDDDDDVVAAGDREDERRRRREVLRLRLRDFASRARSGGRNRILDWAEVLMGLEDNSMEFRFEEDRYVGNPGDYMEAAEYEALLQNLAEGEGRRGAPPASKCAVEALKIVEVRDDRVKSEEEDKYACAICKDEVKVGDVVKEMPCGHGYHGDCIVPWLASRNSCPVCRFELPTDDAEYEEERKKRPTSAAASAGGTSGESGVSDDAF